MNRRCPPAFLLLATWALLGPAPSLGKEAPPPLGTPQPFTLAEQSPLQLPNGLHATLVPLGRVPKATVTAVIRTGGIDDGPVNGLAEFTAELLKEGAGSYGAAELASRAADLGGALNVEAGADEIVVSLDVLAERATDAIDLLADVLRRPRLPASEVERIRANFAREIAVARSEPQTIASEASAKLLWGSHPYGRGLPEPDDLAKYSAELAQQFVAVQFGALRTHLYVVGQFDATLVGAAIDRDFRDWAAGPAPTVNVPSVNGRERVQLINRPGAPQSTIIMGLVTIDPTNPDFLPLALANTLLGGDFIARLDQDLREDKGWTYGVQSRITAQYRVSSWAVDTDVTTAKTADALAEIYRQVDRLGREAPAADELRLHQNYRGGAFVISASSRPGLINQLAFLDLHGLPPDWLTNYPTRIAAITPAQVQAVAQRRLKTNQMSVVVLGDLAKVGGAVRSVKALSGAEWLSDHATGAGAR